MIIIIIKINIRRELFTHLYINILTFNTRGRVRFIVSF